MVQGVHSRREGPVQDNSNLQEEFQDFVNRLGQRIRLLRTARSRSQSQVSEAAGIYDVGKLERGREANPRLYTLFVLARTLKVELKELLDIPLAASGEMDEAEQILLHLKLLMADKDLPTRRKALNILYAFLED
jgi:transcriptional regulator with XRE-family HTH domain